MPEIDRDLPEVYLQPGEVCLVREPTIIRTLLGSCVSVTFWNARLSVGALCHALLPRCPKSLGAGKNPEEGYRFVDFAIRDLARRFDQIGAGRRETQVKLFGGADVLSVSRFDPLRPTVGRQNCDTAIDVLQGEGFRVVASSLGGIFGRSIRFHTGTGEVRLRWLARVAIEDGSRAMIQPLRGIGNEQAAGK
jgi:chemotaxis protein CheD